MRKKIRSRLPPRHRDDGTAVMLIYGIHAVEAALANTRRAVRKVYLTDNAEHRLREALAAQRHASVMVHPRDLERRLGAAAVHQGALIEAAPLEEPALSDLAHDGAGGPVLVVDQVTDPHNVGAILRSAWVFGAAAVVMTRRHSPPLEGALAKAASGALEHVPVISVSNLARALANLKELGFLVVGLEAAAPDVLDDLVWPQRTALVFGAEGRGLRQLTRDSCDQLRRIATDGKSASLNVSNAAAVALHIAAAKRRART